ncbi:MAG: M20/M25/M40 family metallo-hydrolase [Bacteroidetes bacterium]|nr:M20/M25/M40 family metallo-hydrolase [Bacteroidota bacterium]
MSCYQWIKRLWVLSAVFIHGAFFAQQEPASVLSSYIRIQSVSGHEKQAALYMQHLCDSMGLYTSVFSDSDSSYNFCASLLPLPSSKPSVLLLNHLDVVPAEDPGGWKFPPFSGAVHQDTIYGRGALDMKGLAVMQLFALQAFKQTHGNDSLKYNVAILFLSGEETGGKNGAATLMHSEWLSRLNPAVVFGEGGGGLRGAVPGKENDLCFFVSNAEKKSLWLKLEVNVRSRGHGSVASVNNANKILLRAIDKIERSERRIYIDKSTQKTFRELGKVMGGTRGFIVGHLNWWIFKPFRKKVVSENEAMATLVTNSYQLTRLQNPGGSVNQVAQTATAFYDCRLLPNKSERPLFMKFLFRIIDPRIKITVLDESPEADPSELGVHYEALQKAILSEFPQAHVLPVLFPATTDNSYFRQANIPAYGVLPFVLSPSMMESVHAGNERIPVQALGQGIRVYEALLNIYLKR